MVRPAETPHPLRDRVLELLLEQDGRPLAVRDLVRQLGLGSDGRREIKAVLRSMMDDGEVVSLPGARVGLPSRLNLVVGRLTTNPGGFGFVVPERRTTAQEDVYIASDNLKEAMNGDRVVARVERMTQKGPEGRIVRILERGMQRLVGRFESDGRIGGRVIPFDKRVLFELFVPPGDEAGAASGDMVSVEITRPPTPTRNPLGRVLAVLGKLADPGVDVLVIMNKYGLPDAFPDEVEAEAARVPTKVGEAEMAGRRDFRDWTTVTIDPETARDHDDALSVRRMPNGHWMLAVHIADVGHYVRPGSAIDQEAYLRGTSVYFPDRVVPMLPHALSSSMCSLVEGQDRLTQTAVLELDAKGRVRRLEFADGIIRSAARLSYQQVQAIVDGDQELRARLAPLVPDLLALDELAKLMRQRRWERGSLDFDLPEPKLILGASGEMTGITASARLDSMRLVEECMLAANEAVARALAADEVPTLFRVHEQPDPERVEEFSDLVASFGYRMPPDVVNVKPHDFQHILKQIEGKPEEKLIGYLLLRTMRLARYHEENLGHFGLATQHYLHFTSPIRRYPDLVAHRALRAMRHGQRAQAEEMREALPEMGRHLSEMERRASDAERELIEWKKVRFMADKLGEQYDGYVTGVQPFGLFIELVQVYVQGLVHISSMTDDYYAYMDKAHTLRGENAGRVYRLGDRVRVQVVRVDLERRQVDLALVDVLERHASGQRRQGPPPPSPRRGGAVRQQPSRPQAQAARPARSQRLVKGRLQPAAPAQPRGGRGGAKDAKPGRAERGSRQGRRGGRLH